VNERIEKYFLMTFSHIF